MQLRHTTRLNSRIFGNYIPRMQTQGEPKKNNALSRVLGGLTDGRMVLILALVSVMVGGVQLFAWTGSLIEPRYLNGAELFLPALMIASGRGFVEPVSTDVPALRDFLNGETVSFSPCDLPADMPTQAPSLYITPHRYLSYAVALTWRLFGVSWEAVKIPLVIFFGISVICVYDIARLAMGRGLSAAIAIAFMLSPGTLGILPTFRDFSKAPFILATVFVLGCLMKYPRRPRSLLLLAAALGLLQGVGLGFRGDLIICVPPTLLVLTFFVRGKPALPIPLRICAVILFLTAFVGVGWTMLTTGHETRVDTYRLNMGFASMHDQEIGLTPASYERIYLLSDVLNTALNSDFDRRARAIDGRDPATLPFPERQFFNEMVKTFPADILARGYSAVLRILEGTDSGMMPWPDVPDAPVLQRAFARLDALLSPVRWCGPYCAAAVLLVIAARNLSLGWGVLLLTLYFLGYASLQFQFRHFFHLAFAPLWFLGFLINALFLAAAHLKSPEYRREAWNASRPAARRLALFCIGAAVLILGPLTAARLWQIREVNALLKLYASAELTPLPTQRQVFGEVASFVPTAPVGQEPCLLKPQGEGYESAYLVAEFEAGAAPRPLWLHYESLNYSRDFSADVLTGCLRSQPEPGGTIKYFFPVYQFFEAESWNRFAGVAMRDEDVPAFRGLYQVKDIEHFRLLINLSLPPDLSDFQRYQKIKVHRGNPEPAWPLVATRLPDSKNSIIAADSLVRAGDIEAAIHTYETALERDPANTALWCGLVRADAKEDQWETARAACFQAIDCAPTFPPLYSELDDVLKAQGDVAFRVAQWRDVVAKHADTCCPRVFLSRALKDQGDLAGAVDACRAAYACMPGDPSTRAEFQQTLAAYAQAQQDAGLADEATRIRGEAESLDAASGPAS